MEMGSALCLGYAAQRVEQFGDIRRGVAVRACVTRGMQTRRASERIHAEAGVVAECGQSGTARSIARLDQCVFDERRSGFGGVGDAEFALRNEFDIEVA